MHCTYPILKARSDPEQGLYMFLILMNPGRRDRHVHQLHVPECMFLPFTGTNQGNGLTSLCLYTIMYICAYAFFSVR